jgi:hypothetical protein
MRDSDDRQSACGCLNKFKKYVVVSSISSPKQRTHIIGSQLFVVLVGVNHQKASLFGVQIIDATTARHRRLNVQFVDADGRVGGHLGKKTKLFHKFRKIQIQPAAIEVENCTVDLPFLSAPYTKTDDVVYCQNWFRCRCCVLQKISIFF